MIRSFIHKGLEIFYRTGSKRGIDPNHSKRLRQYLALLDTAVTIDDMAAPGARLHALRGSLDGYWAMTISGNWRFVFMLEESEAYDVNYIDYH